MPNEGGGGIMSHKIAGIPTVLIVGVVGLIAYFVFFRNSQSGVNPATSGGGGTITTGNTTIDTGAVQVTVSQGGTHNAKPGKKPPHKKPPPPHKCRKGFTWDADANGGKGKCVKHKEKPGESSSAGNSPMTNTAQTPASVTGAAVGANPQPTNPLAQKTRKSTMSFSAGGTV
jgi:hypothetical protein